MKKVKMILAAAAVMFAVAGALATNASENSLLLVNVAEIGKDCQLVGTCTNVTGPDCKEQLSPGVFRFFKVRQSDTVCPTVATGTFAE